MLPGEITIHEAIMRHRGSRTYMLDGIAPRRILLMLNHLDMKQETKLLSRSNPSGHFADDYKEFSLSIMAVALDLFIEFFED